MLECRYAPAQPLTASQPPQPFRGGQPITIQARHHVERRIEGIKGRRDRLPINDTISHTPKLTKTTDKQRPLETAESKVAQVI